MPLKRAIQVARFLFLRARLATLGDVGTEGDLYREPTIPELRLRRMKHLRVDGVTFADMVPVLIEDGLIPEHGNHVAKPKRVPGRRSEERAASVCGHCEHLIHEQWKRAIPSLSADESVLLEARFLWINHAARQVVKYESLAIQDVKITTTRRRKVEDQTDADGKPADAFVIETTTREERRIYPQLFAMADELRANMARLAGVPVGELSRVPSPAGAGRGKGKLVVYERTDDAGDSEPAAN